MAAAWVAASGMVASWMTGSWIITVIGYDCFVGIGELFTLTLYPHQPMSLHGGFPGL